MCSEFCFETLNSLFIDGKTLYPKKQFHSSPSWVCLHLSGTTPPQYLMGQILPTWWSHHFFPKTVHLTKSWHVMTIFTCSHTWCLSWWSQWENSWQCPRSPCSGTACCPGTSRNQTDLVLVSQCAPVPPAALPHGPHSGGPLYHPRCMQKYDIFLVVL